jgi:hypothetical protein
MNYGVGVRAAPGYCSIEWTQASNDPYSFTVSGDTEVVQPPGKYSAQSFADHDQPSLDHPRNKCVASFKSALPIYGPIIITYATSQSQVYFI